MSTVQILHMLSGFYDSHSGVLNLLVISAIVNMPTARGVLYGWLRATLQSFIGALKPHPQDEKVAGSQNKENPTQQK